MQNHMKHNMVLKSLDELSPELLAIESANAIGEQATPAESELVKQKLQLIFQPVGFLSESDVRGYRGWGINE